MHSQGLHIPTWLMQEYFLLVNSHFFGPEIHFQNTNNNVVVIWVHEGTILSNVYTTLIRVAFYALKIIVNQCCRKIIVPTLSKCNRHYCVMSMWHRENLVWPKPGDWDIAYHKVRQIIKWFRRFNYSVKQTVTSTTFSYLAVLHQSPIINCENTIFYIPKPKIVEQIKKPGKEKSILYTISMTTMHPPATIKCFGEEKTICSLQKDKRSDWLFVSPKVDNMMTNYICLNQSILNFKQIVDEATVILYAHRKAVPINW